MDGDSVLEAIRQVLQPLLLPSDQSHPLGHPPHIGTMPGELVHWLQQLGTGLEAISSRVQENNLRSTNLERLLNQAEHRHKMDEEKIHRLVAELTSANNSEKGKSTDQNEEHRRALEGLQADLALNQGRLERCETEKLELVRVLERKQGEMDSLNGQLEALLKRQAQYRQEGLAKDSTNEELRRQLAEAQIEASKAGQQLESLQKQSEWTSFELERTIAELGGYRKQKMEEIATLRAEMEQSTGRVLTLEKQLANQRSTLEEREEKLEQTLQQLLAARETLAEQERSFVAEMDSKSKLVDLYRSSSEEASARVADLEQQLAEAQESLAMVDERFAGIQAEFDKQRDQLRVDLEEKSAVIESLKAQVSVTEGIGAISGMANAALQTVKTGQSFAQVYTELSQTRTDLLEATQENERLKVCLRDICEDIEARLPGIQADREENGKLKATVSTLSERMLSLSQERDRLQAEFSIASKEKDALCREVRALEQQVKDLGLQVQSLLMNQNAAAEAGEGEVMTADQIITRRLVPIQSIAELQIRNQELLRVTRELAERAEAAESKVSSSEGSDQLKAQLEEAVKEISNLRESRLKQAAVVEGLVSKNTTVASMATSIDLTADDTDERGSRLSAATYDPQLTAKYDELRGQFMEAKAALAKAQAKSDFAQERYEVLKASYDACRQDLEHTRATSIEQGKGQVRLQADLQRLASELVEAKEAVRRAESEVSITKSTLAVSQSTEQRLISEKETLKEEKQRLSGLLSSLQALISENEASSQSLRERLNSQVEFLERELQAVRKKLDDVTEGHRLELAANSRENKELRDKIASLYEELRNTAAAATAASSKQHQERASATAIDEAAIEKIRAVSQANERNLLEVSKAFDDYRAEAESRIEALESTLASARAQLEAESNRHKELEDSWSSEKASMSSKMAELSELEIMLNEHAGLRSEDIAKLQSVLAETQSQLEAERIASTESTQKLQTAEEAIDKLRTQVSSLDHELSQLKHSYSFKETELGERLKTVESEKGRSLDKIQELEAMLQAQLNPASTISSNDEIVALLRRQKDMIQADLHALQTDNRRLATQLDQTKSLLDEARARLAEEQSSGEWRAQMIAQYDRLKQGLDGMAALKETNAELTAQNERLQRRVTELESVGRNLQSFLDQASLKLRESQASEETHNEHLRLITTDRDAWKERALAGGSANDTERIAELTDENAKLTERGERLEAKVQQLLKQCMLFKTQGDDLRKRVQAIEENPAEVTQNTEELDALKAQVQALLTEKEGANLKLNRFQAALKEFAGLRSEYNALKAQHEELKKQSGSAAISGIEEYKRENEMRQKLVLTQWQNKVKKLEGEVASLQDQLTKQLDETIPEPKRVRTEVPQVREEVQEEPTIEEVSSVPQQLPIELGSEPEEPVPIVELQYDDEDDGEEEDDLEGLEEDGDYDMVDLDGEDAIEVEEVFMEEEAHEEDIETPDIEMEKVEPVVETPPVIEELELDQAEPVVQGVHLDPEELDIDQFLVDQDLQPKVNPTTTAASTSEPKPTSRTIHLPTTGTTTATAASFTPAPAPKGRVIDLSQISRRIPPPATTATTASAAPAPAATKALEQQPQTVKPGGKTGKFLLRGGRGRGKFRRGGHGGGNAGGQPSNNP